MTDPKPQVDTELMKLDRLAVRAASLIERAAQVDGSDGGESLLQAYALVTKLQERLAVAVRGYMAGHMDKVQAVITMQLLNSAISTHKTLDDAGCRARPAECPVCMLAGVENRNLPERVVNEVFALREMLLVLSSRIIGRIEGQEGCSVEELIACTYGDTAPLASDGRPLSVLAFETSWGFAAAADVLWDQPPSELTTRTWPRFDVQLFEAERAKLTAEIKRLCDAMHAAGIRHKSE